jgi:hypothetical protein
MIPVKEIILSKGNLSSYIVLILSGKFFCIFAIDLMISVSSFV